MSAGDKTRSLHPKKRGNMLYLSLFTLFHQRFGFTKQTTEKERKYVRRERENFMSDEKRQLGELAQCYKAEYDILVINGEGKTKFDQWRGKHGSDLSKKDYVSRALQSFYIDMKDRKSNDDDLKWLVSLQLLVLNTYQN